MFVKTSVSLNFATFLISLQLSVRFFENSYNFTGFHVHWEFFAAAK